MESHKPHVSAIIVSWNTKELLRTCLQGLVPQQDIHLQIIVVDNNSQDGSQDMVRKEFPNVSLICNTVNRGFAAANNQGLRIAQGEVMVLINPDIEFLSPDTCRIIAETHTHHHAGIVGPRLLNSDRSLQPSVRRNPDALSQFLIISKLQFLFKNSKSLNSYFATDFNYAKSQEVQQLSGAFFSIHTSCLSKVGLLDEAFWIWFEEVDFCMRSQEQKCKIWFTADTEVIHHGGQSFQQVIPRKRHSIFLKSLLRFASKYFTPSQRYVLRVGALLGYALSFLIPSKTRITTYAKK